jgi:hypothetical protein
MSARIGAGRTARRHKTTGSRFKTFLMWLFGRLDPPARRAPSRARGRTRSAAVSPTRSKSVSSPARVRKMTRMFADGEPVTVKTEDGWPSMLIWNDIAHPVARVAERWQVNTDWWSDGGEVDRDYFRVVTKTGLLCEIFYDGLERVWRLARIYD